MSLLLANKARHNFLACFFLVHKKRTYRALNLFQSPDVKRSEEYCVFLHSKLDPEPAQVNNGIFRIPLDAGSHRDDAYNACLPD